MPDTIKSKIDKACQFLITKAAPSYDKNTCGYCARAVRMAFDFGLGGVNIKAVPSAKDYAASYKEVGFKKVFSFPTQDIFSYKPLIGDICIIQPVTEGFKILQPHGHICVFTSRGWVSDFIQRDMHGGSIRKKSPAFDILRLQL
jgi:hypothetical protein